MNSPAKKLNKWLIGFIIGGTILGLTGLSSTEQGRGLMHRLMQKVVSRGRRALNIAEYIGSRLANRSGTIRKKPTG